MTSTQVLSPHDPGTPDEDVSPKRLQGRIAFRQAQSLAESIGREIRNRPELWNDGPLNRLHREHVDVSVNDCPYMHGPDRIDWFLGYYDGRLRRFYSR